MRTRDPIVLVIAAFVALACAYLCFTYMPAPFDWLIGGLIVILVAVAALMALRDG